MIWRTAISADSWCVIAEDSNVLRASAGFKNVPVMVSQMVMKHCTYARLGSDLIR
jgi:hypothetical protein